MAHSEKRGFTFCRPLLPVALALISGITLGSLLPGFLMAVGLAVGATALAIIIQIRRRSPGLILALMFCLGAGYLSIQPWLRRELPAGHVRQFVDQGKWIVTGTVADQPQGSGRQQAFTLQSHRLGQGQRTFAVHGKIKVTVMDSETALRRGDAVVLSGHLHAIRGFCNPGGFDYQRYMALQGVHVKLYAQGKSLRHAGAADPGAMARLDDIRRNLSLAMDAALTNYPPSALYLLKALTLGEQQNISPELREAFNRAGVSHVLAISGLHIGLVATAAFALFSRLLCWMPLLLRHGWVRRGAALLTLVPVAGYGLLAGLSPSTQRAMLMTTALMLTFWVGRRHDWLNALAVAALMLAIAFPPVLLTISFQLSFAAVSAILIGMRVWPFPRTEGPKTLWRRWSERAVALIAVSVFATLGTLPLVLFYFNQISWIGPLTNLWVVPLVGMLILPAGLLGILCAWCGSSIATFCWQVAAVGLEGVIRGVEETARWPFAASTTVTPSPLEMALFYLLLAVLCFWRKRPLRIAGLIIVMLIGSADALYWSQRRFGRGTMVVTAVDVGQGSANVLQLPGGFTVLVDGGGFSDGGDASFDIGRMVLAPYLWRNKIRTVDLVVLTHPNSDHLNGLLFILRRFQVGEIWSNQEPAGTMGYRKWRQIIAERGLVHLPFAQLPRRTVRNGVSLEILAPPADFRQARPRETWRDENNNSLVLKVGLGEIAFLFTGDIDGRSEADLIARNNAAALRSTVLLIPHHGSRKSCTAALLKAVQPAEGLLAAGWRNHFHFPHTEVLDRLAAAHCRLWRTDLHGAVRIVTNGKDYQIEVCRQECN